MPLNIRKERENGKKGSFLTTPLVEMDSIERCS